MRDLQAINIKSYRGIKELELNKLSFINIFVGENNTGKTSILEAIQLISNPFSASEFRMLSRQREKNVLGIRYQDKEEGISWMFSKDGKDLRIPISINYTFNAIEEKISYSLSEEDYYIVTSSIEREETNKDIDEDDSISIVKEQTVKISQSNKYDEVIKSATHVFGDIPYGEFRKESIKDRLFNCNYISAVDHRMLPISIFMLNKLIQEGKRDELLKTLRFFDSKIKGIEILVNNSKRTTPYIEHIDLGIVPISIFGDGLRKALLVASKVIASEGGVLLIDEIETGIHTNLIPEFINWVSDLCIKYNVQLFATTHSLEAVDGIVEANINRLEKVSFYRLVKKDSFTKARYFSGENMKNIRYEFGQDVR
ncbi:ATP-binding protein [Metaplanococcus flavidus]